MSEFFRRYYTKAPPVPKDKWPYKARTAPPGKTGVELKPNQSGRCLGWKWVPKNPNTGSKRLVRCDCC